MACRRRPCCRRTGHPAADDRAGGRCRQSPGSEPEFAAVRAADDAGSDRAAVLVLCLVLQQRLTRPGPTRRGVGMPTADQQASPCRLPGDPGHRRRRRTSPASPTSPWMCRRAGLPPPTRQAVRTGPGGRVYLDVAWEEDRAGRRDRRWAPRPRPQPGRRRAAPERGHPQRRHGAAHPGTRPAADPRNRSWPRSCAPIDSSKHPADVTAMHRARLQRASCIATRPAQAGVQGAGELGDGAAGLHSLGLEAVVGASSRGARPRQRSSARGGPAAPGRGRRTPRCPWRSAAPRRGRAARRAGRGCAAARSAAWRACSSARVGKEQVHRLQGPRGHPVGEERHRVVGVHPQVADSGPSAAASIRATPGTCTSTARSASGCPTQHAMAAAPFPSRSRRPGPTRPNASRETGRRAAGARGAARHPLLGQRAVAPARREGAHALAGGRGRTPGRTPRSRSSRVVSEPPDGERRPVVILPRAAPTRTPRGPCRCRRGPTSRRPRASGRCRR